jgi:hypothetical protein
LNVKEGVDPSEPSLDLGKTNVGSAWAPGDEMPAWWGQDNAVCGVKAAVKYEDGRATWVPVLCKRWTCDVCGFYRKAWLIRNIVKAMNELELDRFWTLTLNTSGRTADESFDDLQEAWGKLHDRMTRTFGRVEYVWVVEPTRAGYAHMHLLVNRYIPQAWMSVNWLKVTGDSRIVHVERLTGRRAAAYLAKYVSKEATRRLASAGLKRRRLFGRSKGVKFDSFMPGGKGWTVVMQSWKDNADWLRRHCYVEVDTMLPTPRIVVVSAGRTEYLRTWGTLQSAIVKARAP